MWLNELKTLFRRRRTIALLAGLALIPVVVSVAVKISHGPSNGGGPQFLSQVSENGFFSSLVGLTLAVPFLLPLTIGIVGGDAIAGEANLGTLRYVLSSPLSRTRLLLVKYAATLVFSVAAAVVIIVAGMIVGSALFGIHAVVSLSGTTLSLSDGILRALLAAIVVGLSMGGLAAVGLFISTLTEQPVGAMAATTVVAVVSEVLDSIPQLSAIHTMLFTHYWMNFVDLFRTPTSYGGIEKDLLLQLAWIVVFGSAAWAKFTSSDVLA